MHKARYNHNYNQYQTSTPAEGLPNGGGFSIIRFNLLSLFEQHELAHNLWTKSNKNFPLFRYTGCTITVYRPLYVDLVLKFQLCYPMCCSKLMYTGTQPSIMMMTHGTKRIRCKQNAPNKKPYKKFKLSPPQQMMNKWYFQHDQSQTGLLLIQAAAASFDQYYASHNADSSTITLLTLNTKIFHNLNFANFPQTTGYFPKKNFYLWATNGAQEPEVGDLIWLGQSKLYNWGKQLKDFKTGTSSNFITQAYKKYMEDPKNWGNIFHKSHINQSNYIWFTTQSPSEIFTEEVLQRTQFSTKLKDFPATQNPQFHKLTQELFFRIRYNPFKDKGYENNIYIKSNWQDNTDLEPPADPDLQNPGFPNWLACFGFEDYLKKLGTKSQIDTHYMMVHKSIYFEPKLEYYIFLDDFFFKGDSDDYEGRLDWENQNWYPMITHQQQYLNTLALSGPGTPKTGDIKLAEAKIAYDFYFKIGGCAPPVQKITDPTKQPTFATPNNLLDTNSLQNPEQSVESYLYQFDWRRDQITETAAKRITKDFSTEKSLFTDAATPATEVPLLQTHEKDLISSEEEETQKETLFEQLIRQRNKQKLLRYRIKQLINQIQKLE